MTWVVTGGDVNQMFRMLERCATKGILWAGRKGLHFDNRNIEAALVTLTRGHRTHIYPELPPNLSVGDGLIKFNQQATCWLGDSIDIHLTLKE
jgi:hypothetical protein